MRPILHATGPSMALALGLLISFVGGTARPLVAQEGPQNVRLVFQLVEANGYEGADPEIEDVVAELRQLFRFDGYRLAATGLLNGALDSDAATRLTGEEHGGFTVETDMMTTQTEGMIRIRVQLYHELDGSAMLATVNVRDNQTLVLGSTRTLEGAALILIMRTSFQ